MKNKTLYALVPLIATIVFAVGVLVGTHFIPQGIQQSETLVVNDKFNTILKIIEDKYVDSVDHEMLVESSIDGMIKKLDPHSQYIPPKDLEGVNEQLEGKFGGVGIRFIIHNDTLAVTDVLEHSPSEQAGLKAGDRILQVDDTVLTQSNISNTKVMELLKGHPGTDVEVKIYRKGEVLTKTITRGLIPVSSIDADFMITDQIGFIKLNSFTASAGEEFVESAEKLKDQGMKKLIFDLRNNGGGYMNAATTIIDQFLPSGQLMVYTEGRKAKREEYVSTSSGILQDVDVVVLINALSASASEIVAGAIQDNDRGLIIGRRSFGKGLVQTQDEFTDGSALRLTISRYYTPSGRCIQKPYGDGVDYENDYLHRYESGELLNEDSIHVDESLKYYTNKGRVVYGGGGIYPDVFVPNDTAGASYYLTSLYYAGVFNQWSFKYLDSHRGNWNSFQSFNKQFAVSENQFNELVNYAANYYGIEKDDDGIKRSKEVIKNRMKAEVARHQFGENGFYEIYLIDDKDVLEALHLLKIGQARIGG